MKFEERLEEMDTYYPAIRKLYREKQEKYERGEVDPQTHHLELILIRTFMDIYHEALKFRNKQLMDVLEVSSLPD